MTARLDATGWYIALLHSLLGHDTAARALGVPPGDKAACLICAYERRPDEAARQAVIDALAPRGDDR